MQHQRQNKATTFSYAAQELETTPWKDQMVGKVSQIYLCYNPLDGKIKYISELLLDIDLLMFLSSRPKHCCCLC